MKPRGSRSSATRPEQWHRRVDCIRAMATALSAHGFITVSATVPAAIPAHCFGRPRPPPHEAIRGVPHRRASPFLLLMLPPRPCSPRRSPLPPLHPTSMRNHRCFPQATGHRIAHVPPSTSRKTALKPQLQESPKRRPPFHPLSTERHRMVRPL
jgi:hypothetical protein